MNGGVYIASKLAVLLLRRNSLIPQLTSEERAFDLCKKEIAFILISDIFPNVLSNL